MQTVLDATFFDKLRDRYPRTQEGSEAFASERPVVEVALSIIESDIAPMYGILEPAGVAVPVSC